MGNIIRIQRELIRLINGAELQGQEPTELAELAIFIDKMSPHYTREGIIPGKWHLVNKKTHKLVAER